MDKEKTQERQIVDAAWSSYCDLDYWISDMGMGKSPESIPKNVMKMAMKHLRDELHKIHSIACSLEYQRELRDNNHGEAEHE